jgi:hypothetical protein
MVEVEGHKPGNQVEKVLLGVCNRGAKGGGPGNQIREAEKRAGDIAIVLLRSTPFPTTPNATVTKQIANLIKRGGRRVEVGDSDWRAFLALQGNDQKCLAILRKAIEVLSGLEANLTLDRLRELIGQQDDALLGAVGGYDAKLYKRVAEDLLTLQINQQHLLVGAGERLSVPALLGQDGSVPPGKTRLSVISTRFLPDQTTTDFWVA